MQFSWSEDLRTGIEEIDEQHRELFRRLEDLEAACVRQEGLEEIGRYLGFLLDYAALHFSAEEREMEATNYPDLADHRSEHAQFKREISALNNEVRATGARLTLLHTTLWASSEWLVEHVRGTDRRMATHLKGRRA